jgi:outer membrane protein TolC
MSLCRFAVWSILIAAPFSTFAGQTIKLSADSAVALARSQSVAVKASELALMAQEKAVMSAAATYLPTLSANAGATRLIDKATMGGSLGSGSTFSALDLVTLSRGDKADSALAQVLDGMFSGMSDAFKTPDNIYNIGLTVSQPLFTGGRISKAVKIAKLSHSSQIFTHERTITEIGLLAQQIFWGYVILLKKLEADQETRLWFENLVKDQQKLFENGLIIELDVLNSKIQLDNFKLMEERDNNAIASAKSQLLLFFNLPADADLEVDTSIWRERDADFTPPLPDSVENWLVYREDLQAAKRQLEMMRCLKGLQLASYAPTVAAFGSLSYGNQYSQRESDLKRNSSVGLSLNWTLFDWGKTWNEAKKAEYQAQAFELKINNMHDQIKNRINELARKVQETRNQREIAKEDMEIARRALDIAQKKYDAQAISNTELLSARNQLTNKTVTYALVRISAILALEEYKVAPLNTGMSQ